MVPLVTTGALGALLARFGLRLPRGLEAVLGLAARAGVGGGAGLVGEAVRVASGHQGGAGSGHSRATVERGRDGDWQWEHRRLESDDYAGWGEGGSDWGTGYSLHLMPWNPCQAMYTYLFPFLSSSRWSV